MVGFLNKNYELLRVKFDQKPTEKLGITKDDLSELQASLKSKVTDLTHARQLVQDWVHQVEKVSASSLVGPSLTYIKNLAEQLGKPINVDIKGGDLRLHPAVFKPVTQNIVHLLRNAIDHGIEGPADRGSKPEVASIWVGFKQMGRSVEIEIGDDGQGINLHALKEAALKKGLVDRNKLSSLSDEQTVDLVFLDGLSTATVVTDTSGRGVGMSALRAAVEEAGGRVKIETQAGRGTKFHLTIPDIQAEHTLERKAA